MRQRICKVPIPIAGVALGLAALGNLLQSYSGYLRWVCGGVSALLMALLLLKIILFPDMIRKDYGNSILASVSATIFMTVMQLAGYVRPLLGVAATAIWLAAIICHLTLIVWFTLHFIRNFRLEEVYPTYFIAYVGIVVAAVTAPTFDMAGLGTVIFWFGFSLYLVMLVLVTMRYRSIPVAPAAKPLFCIYAAPMSLSLAGYLSSVESKSVLFAVVLAVAAQILYIMVLTQLPKLLKLPFYPSYAAFTFPFVITAFALKKLLAWLVVEGYTVPAVLNAVVLVETVFAAAMVTYVLARYLYYLFGGLLQRTSVPLKHVTCAEKA
ncbi:MAG: TDT family transporter [Pseudoflavonifractor sp.]